MLLIHRKPGELIHIGQEITIEIVESSSSRTTVGIIAPDRIKILRGELVIDGADWSPHRCKGKTPPPKAKPAAKPSSRTRAKRGGLR